ncbi:MAG: HDOD domain-containing protein [Pseudomonadales bacterium]|nr:HDOD domain-containing protein [Pseudomonadales bacterium]
MAIPASVQKCLDLQNISYDIAADSTIHTAETTSTGDILDPNAIVKLVLLQDSLGMVQVLMPGNCLLDLNGLCELLGRSLQAATAEESDKIKKRHGLEMLAAVPKLTEFSTIADHCLFEKPFVFLESGVPGIYVKLAQDQFKRAVAESDLGSFSTLIAPYVTQSNNKFSDDEAKITKAVEQFTSLRIKQRLENTLELPPMPDTAERIIKLRVDPDAGVSELASVVETDPSLAAQVVSWASSPYYAAPGKITSVQDAVVRVLGFDLVINLALGLALGKSLALPQDGPRGITPYWQQAVFTAAATEQLVKAMPKGERPAIGMAYLSGLLHNFGYLVLGFVFPPHFTLISRLTEVNEHVCPSVIDEYLLGLTREQISAWLMKVWHMPEEIVTALRWQQDAAYEDQYSPYPNLLFLSNQLLRQQGIGDCTAQPIPDELYQRLHLEPDEAFEAIQKTVDNADHLQTIARNLAK